MLIALAIVIGALFAVAVFLMMRRTIIDSIFGVILLSHAANLLVFSAGGLHRGEPPLLEESHRGVAVADPIPQALVLTAIVIGFGVVAFAMVLVARLYRELGSDDGDLLRQQEEP